MQRAARGRIRVIGAGRNRVDLTCIDNAAWAHLDAAGSLTGPDARCAGKPYFISNGQPVLLWAWLNQLFRELDLPAVTRSVPLGASRLAGRALELVWGALPTGRQPPITRFLAAALARSHWYDIGPAERDLGYRVRVPMDEATRRTARWLADLLAGTPPPGHARRRRNAAGKERPHYYLAPSHDFTQYTKDWEEKHWSRETAFEWQRDVPGALRRNLESLPPDAYQRLAMQSLPLVRGSLERLVVEIQRVGLLPDANALRAIGELIPSDRPAIEEGLGAQAPLASLGSTARLRDQLVILTRVESEARERRRLGLVQKGTAVKRLETRSERLDQAEELRHLRDRVRELRRAVRQSGVAERTERLALEARIGVQLAAITPRVLADLGDALALVRRVLDDGRVPFDGAAGAQVRDLLWKRQLRALTDIANHALVVEQSAIAPLAVGIIHYKRRREVQEAMTTFVSDEAKHSAVFRRFMAEKLHARERIPDAIIRSGDRYLWLARVLPSGGVFLAVIVEAIGAAYLEFFGEEGHMPDPLFRSICRTIAERDERRHLDLCVATYNELYRTGTRWEAARNRVALRIMMKAAYGDKTIDHPLLQACCAFGLEPVLPYRHVADGLSRQLARIGVRLTPDELLGLMRFSAPSG
jgi:hypothetical protein